MKILENTFLGDIIDNFRSKCFHHLFNLLQANSSSRRLQYLLSFKQKRKQWYHNLNLFIFFSLDSIKDFNSNSTTSAQGHKTDQETSRDYNTHVDYESTTNIDLDDIFISVKTTKKYHDSRLKAIVKTWFQLARDQVIFRLIPFRFLSASALFIFS